MVAGNPGDIKPVGGGVWELRIHYGPGYRVYFLGRRGIVILLSAVTNLVSRRTSRRHRTWRRSGDDEGNDAPWDQRSTSRHLRTRHARSRPEEAGDDPAFIAHTLGVIARSGNLSALARETGLSREGLYKALSEDGNPSFATIMKVAKALGLRIEFHAVA